MTIETWSETLAWANAFVLEAYRLQARPMLLFVDEPTYWDAVEELPAASLGRVGSHEWAALRETDAYVFFYGPNDTDRENRLPPGVESALSAYDSEWYRIVEKAHVRAVRLDIGRSNAAEARRLGLDLGSWRKELVDAILVDPGELQRTGARVGRTLHRGKELRITHPNGTALNLRLRGRRPRVYDGVIDSQDLRFGEVVEALPSGWVAVAPDERYAEGEFVANVQSAVAAYADETGPVGPGRGGRWTFRAGKLERFSYDEGGERFAKLYQKLGPGKERPGGINIGLNPRIRSLPRLEDQRLGRVTLMIGRNTYIGGSNQTPYFHGYLILDGADLQVDGETLIHAGKIE